MTTNFKFNGKTYSARLVAIVEDVYKIYVDKPHHIALLVDKDYTVIDTKHLESWQQDALVEDDKTDEETAKAREVIDLLREYWQI